ncbi:diflavin oxidoreductase [Allorhizobium undicola]|uniref:diflavin oxidoreductase n=1 Tax=Allorhizobium undicola TaxID=78527 RepID=UPI0006854B54|nr:sulfite reductase flavoprotein subunit alpha [Allorhizobium undicola]
MKKERFAISGPVADGRGHGSGMTGRISGWLSGLLGRRVTPQVTRPEVAIVYASQTGNAENLARDAAAMAAHQGVLVHLAALDDMDVHDLANFSTLIAFVSTYGEGDMPDNGQAFWQALTAAEAPLLEGKRFAVLGLGNSSYRDFCRAGRQLDARLHALGGHRLLERLDCDVEYEEVATQWIGKLLATLADRTGKPEAARGETVQAYSVRKKTFSPARLVRHIQLTAPDASRDVHHLEFDIADTGLTYQAGDAVGIRPVNDPEIVKAILSLLGVGAEYEVGGRPISAVLEREVELRSPSADLIRALAEQSRDEAIRRLLAEGDMDAIATLLRRGDVLDALRLAPAGDFSPETLLPLLKPLQPRSYSISSSPLCDPGRLHITVGSLRYQSDLRYYGGACSTYLADRLKDGACADICILPNSGFKLPEDASRPVVMIGPGTGIAPFRGFLRERAAKGGGGRNWLFFGNRNEKKDFLYREDLLEAHRSGILHRLDLAFSRDQSEKIYVQHRILERGADLWAWLEEGAAVYVCGDASQMARDVEQALMNVIARHGGMSPEHAKDYLARMRSEKRYMRDVY